MSETMQTQNEAQNGQTFTGKADDLANVAAASLNMNKQVTILSDGHEIDVNDELENSLEQGHRAFTQELENSDSQAKIQIRAFYYIINDGDTVVVSE